MAIRPPTIGFVPADGTVFVAPLTYTTVNGASQLSAVAPLQSSVIGGYTTTTPNTVLTGHDFAPVCASHELDAGPAVFIDGTLAGYCKTCGERMAMGRTMGGMAYKMLAAMLEVLTDGPLADAIAMLCDVERELIEERNALDEGDRIVALARQTLLEQLKARSAEAL